MHKHVIKTIEDIAPFVHEYLLPEIQQSVEACIKSYWDDEFNDMWIFGTHLWKNTWNRFKSAVEFEDCPFDVCGKGNEFKLKIGPFIVRHHRIDDESRLPNGAKAVKSSATHIQMTLFSEEWDPPVEIDNIIIAIDADTQKGLKEVFIGELMPLSHNPKKFRWVKKIPVFLADGVEISAADIVEFSMPGFKQQVPVEEIPEVTIELDPSRARTKTAEGDITK